MLEYMSNASDSTLLPISFLFLDYFWLIVEYSISTYNLGMYLEVIVMNMILQKFEEYRS